MYSLPIEDEPRHVMKIKSNNMIPEKMAVSHVNTLHSTPHFQSRYGCSFGAMFPLVKGTRCMVL
jgi:hypothetical protein